MAVISMFYGIIISLFFYDNRQHNLPHIHASYQEHEAIFSIPEGKLIIGNIPLNKALLVAAWIEIHKEDLIADWKLASSGQEIFKIEPLK
jgi:hypothetical protein